MCWRSSEFLITSSTCNVHLRFPSVTSPLISVCSSASASDFILRFWLGDDVHAVQFQAPRWCVMQRTGVFIAVVVHRGFPNPITSLRPSCKFKKTLLEFSTRTLRHSKLMAWGFNDNIVNTVILPNPQVRIYCTNTETQNLHINIIDDAFTWSN